MIAKMLEESNEIMASGLRECIVRAFVKPVIEDRSEK